jgi:hypothetical protein
MWSPVYAPDPGQLFTNACGKKNMISSAMATPIFGPHNGTIF